MMKGCFSTYYKQVGPDHFKQKTIGAGSYTMVRQELGIQLAFEAFKDYYCPLVGRSFNPSPRGRGDDKKEVSGCDSSSYSVSCIASSRS
jgi:hypothetical protein